MSTTLPIATPFSVARGQSTRLGVSSNGKVFYGNLEALRGIAALAVAFGHCLGMLPFPTGPGYELAACIMNGGAAVSVFFVLSGFVLTLAMRRGTGSRTADYAAFEIRRGFRIMPVYLVVGMAIGLFGRLYLPIHFPDGIKTWWGSIYDGDNLIPHAREIVRHLLLLDTRLNPVAWTLQVEVGASILLPFIIWTNWGLPLAGKFVFQVPMLVLAFVLHRAQHPHSYVLGILWPFYLGVLIADLGPALWKRFRPAQAWWIIMTSWAVLLGARLIPGQTGVFICEQFAAFIIVGGLVHGPPNWIGRMLDHPIAKFYGRISYCFYLVHFIVLYPTALLLARFLPVSWIPHHLYLFGFLVAILSTGIATLISWLLHVSVEQPCIRISKQICARWFSPHETEAVERNRQISNIPVP